ncbi:MAG: PEP/pyruvate-binding domain-containing protein [Candidatus Odinarchaeota archaeon]
MNLVYTLQDTTAPTIEQVGGKGLSLIHAAKKGFTVPSAVVLSTDFFIPWIEKIKATQVWQAFTETTGDGLLATAKAVKETCQNLAFSDTQQQAIADIRDFLQVEGIPLVAVRSSSPEEDLEGTSFAGIYETVLGVTDKALEEAIKTCFASALDERVVAYKKERGYDPFDPKIAVVIQKQIASEVAGVAFSLNPVTNCYDECVINANFGLGETVVDGTVTPDQFTVDKIKNTILEKIAGNKDVTRYVKATGGMETKTIASPSAFCLTDDQVMAITSLTSRIEAEYGKPMDIEWAYEEGQLYLLQARPITGYFQLPPEMITKPGERKRLYQDTLLTEQGLVESLSPLGEDIYNLMIKSMMIGLGADSSVAEREKGLIFSSAGRAYADIGRMVKLTGKKTTIKTFRTVDAVGAEILENLDLKDYKKGLLPPKRLLWNIVKMSLGGIKVYLKTRKAYNKPTDYLEYFLEKSDELVKKLKADYLKNVSFGAYSQVVFEKSAANYLNFIFIPILLAAEQARSRIKKLFKNEPQSVQDQIFYIERAFPHNVTIEMGLLLHDLSQFPDVQQTATITEFLQKLDQKQVSADFMEKWQLFMERYGHRYPREIDVASPRYREKPGEVFTLLKTIGSSSDPELTPRGIFENGTKKREETIQFLVEILKKKGKKKVKIFQKNYRVLEAFAAYRESLKYYLIIEIDYIRRRILALAEQWVEDGRLDSVEQVFNLKHEEVVQGETNPDLDLRPLIAANIAYYGQFKRNTNPSVLIDSRGFIPALLRKAIGENEFTGTPVSPGIVKGPVKILSRPDEKPILPGDILVARATDPGWTTLFLNAGGVLIETGGTLQHGAAVARESCKPCVVGLDRITTLLEDGQIVELDGSTGIVRILE